MEKLSIEERLQLLEDKEAIKEITYQYAMFINHFGDIVNTIHH